MTMEATRAPSPAELDQMFSRKSAEAPETNERTNPPISPFADKLRAVADRIETFKMGRLQNEAIKENTAFDKNAQNEAFDSYAPNIEAPKTREQNEKIEEVKDKLRTIGRAAILPFRNTLRIGGSIANEARAIGTDFKDAYADMKDTAKFAATDTKNSVNNSREAVKGYFTGKIEAAQSRKADRVQARQERSDARTAERENKRAERLEAATQAAEAAQARKEARKVRRAELLQSTKDSANSLKASASEKFASGAEMAREKAKLVGAKIGEAALTTAGAGLAAGEAALSASKSAAETAVLKSLYAADKIKSGLETAGLQALYGADKAREKSAEVIDKTTLTARRARALGSTARSAFYAGATAARTEFDTHNEQNRL